LDAVEGWQIRRRVPFDGVIVYSKTHEEIKGAFLTFHKDVVQIYPEWKE
jgi:hypothetical protein